jgi:6-phosphogluconolactonase (cycloisomerase 2 family)
MGKGWMSSFLLVCISILFGGAGCAPVQAGFLYVLNDVDGGPNQIYGYQVNETSGVLTLLTGFPMPTGGNGSQNLMSQRMCYDSAHSRLYVINGGSDTLSAYAVNLDNGMLTPMPFSPVALPAGPAGQEPKRCSWSCMAVHPSGSLVVLGRDLLDVANEPGQLASFVITSTTATLASGSPYFTGNEVYPYSCAFSQDGLYLYTGGNRDTTAYAGFSVNTTTGVLTALQGSPFTSDGYWPIAFAADGLGRLFLHSYHNKQTGQLEVYLLASGVPSAVTASPFNSALDDGIFSILHPAGFIMVADRSFHTVGVYRITGTGAGTTLAPVSGSPFASGAYGTTALALNAAGTFLYAANNWTRSLTRFAVDASTGVLSNAYVQPVYTLGSSGYLTGIAYASKPAGPLRGDLNLDGVVDDIDADLLAQLLASSLLEFQIPAPENGDLDENGLLNVVDLGILRREIAR